MEAKSLLRANARARLRRGRGGSAGAVEGAVAGEAKSRFVFSGSRARLGIGAGACAADFGSPIDFFAGSRGGECFSLVFPVVGDVGRVDFCECLGWWWMVVK